MLILERKRGEEIVLRTNTGLRLGTIEVQKLGDKAVYLAFDFIAGVKINRAEVDALTHGDPAFKVRQLEPKES